MRSRILLAAPDRALQGDYAEFFGRAGFDLDTAADGIECVEKLSRFGADVLVVDADLAWDGAEGVLDCVAGDPNVPWVPVTIATGEVAPDELAARFDLPPRHCLRKPLGR